MQCKRKKLNCVKWTIHHPSLAETSDAELLEDLRKDNKNIAEVFILKKYNPKTNDRVNTANAVITFDAITLPSQIIYLKYNILKTRLYYPNPVQCQNCYKYGHYHSRDRPCNAEKVCENCGEKYHLNREKINLLFLRTQHNFKSKRTGKLLFTALDQLFHVT